MAPAVKGGLAAAGVALAVGAVTLNRTLVGVFYDDGLYTGLALALAGGQGYVHPHLPGAPAAVHYPPVYPLVLAPLVGLFPLHAAALAGKVLNLLLGALGAGLVAWHAVRVNLLGLDPTRAVSRWLAPAVVAATAMAIPVLAVQSVLFSEPLFAVLLATAIIAADRGAAPWLTGLAVALALLTRSIAIAACAGIAASWLVRREPWPRIRAALLPAVAAAVLWGAWVLTHADGIDPAIGLNYGSYGEHLRQAGLAPLAHAPDIARPLAALTLGWIPWRWVYDVCTIAAIGIGLYGITILARRSAIGYTLACYLLVLALWPEVPDRFLWAVLPWLALAWPAGAVALWRRPGGAVRIPVAALAAFMVVGYAVYEARGLAGRWWAGQSEAIAANFAELLPAVAALPADAVLATDNEALVWLYTRRRTVPLYLFAWRGGELVEPDPAAHRAFLERQGVTHVLLAAARGGSARELRALMHTYPGWLAGMSSWAGGRGLFVVTP
ncbi:MAG: hypothetical protein ACREMN_00085 [Gemmatimonadales bacterium]